VGDKVLLWSDEFDGEAGDSVNPNFWNFDLGDGTSAGIPGWGNQEREWYLAEQAKLSGNSELVISAERNPDPTAYPAYYGEPAEWLSAKLTTKNKVEVKYGLIEARVKIPTGVGTWPAFWMLGNNLDEDTWPLCGEIDILEARGSDSANLVATLHGPGYSGEFGCGKEWRTPVSMKDDFHTFAVEWLPDSITWLFDGQPFSRKIRADVSPNQWVFDHPFYIITNLAMGGGFTGEIDPNLTHAEMTLDYVRVSSINGVGEVFIKI
jgi:beta-glucanase (GH16 family)